MRDISLHLLDIVQNSVTANAKHIDIMFTLEDSVLTMTVKDDGKGMSEELLARVRSPFATTRTTRKVGLGIPLLQQNARLTGGDVSIESRLGEGTTISAVFHTASIDCLPLGDLAGTIVTLVLANPETPEFSLVCTSEKGHMSFSTQEVRAALQGVPLSEPEVIRWMQESIQEEIEPILGGIIR